MKLSHAPHLSQARTTSGASRKKIVFSFSRTLFLKLKMLSRYTSWNAGRGSKGRLTTFSKGRRLLKSKSNIINRSYRDTSISFIGGISMNPYSNSLYSIIFSGSGSTSVIPASESHKILSLTFLQSIFFKRSQRLESIIMLKKSLEINPGFYIVAQLPRHTPVSHLEVQPGLGTTLSRSPGSASKILKLDPRTSLSLVKLPSGVRKIISIFAIGSLGKSSLPSLKKINITSARTPLTKGIAPRSRGVAKNPVDHPHGGRTKSIKYPRTPWGLTTKFK
jgi:large subunit ribosomal protein L2